MDAATDAHLLPRANPTQRRAWARERTGVRWWSPAFRFPIVVALAMVALVAFGISGVSVGVYATSEVRRSAVLAGSPNSVRSDEYAVRTPLILGQMARGFPDAVPVGVGSNDVAVLYYVPTRDWSMAFKPQLLGYLVLAPPQANAFDWWGGLAILLVGTYAFVLVALRSMRWAIAGALLLGASPFVNWWHVPTVGASIGFTAGGFAALLIAIREPRMGPRKYLFAALAAYCFVGATFVAYPPFQISATLCFGGAALAIGVHWYAQRKLSWATVVVPLGIVAVGATIAVVLFAAQHHEALTAVAATVYPGARRSAGGDGLTHQILANAWFSPLLARNGGALFFRFRPRGADPSMPMIGLFLIPVLALIWTRISRPGTRIRLLLVALLGVQALFLVYIYVGLPGIVARFTLLNRVPTGRSIAGVGLAALLLYITAGMAIAGSDLSRRRRINAGIGLSAVTIGYIVTVGSELRAVHAPVSRLAILLAASAALLVCATYFWRPFVSALVLILVSVVLVAPVNPLYRGVTPLRNAALDAQVSALVDADPNLGWATDDSSLAAFLTANGYRNQSTTDFYPDRSAWELLDPTRTHEEVWNRYAHVVWKFDANAQDVRIALTYIDSMAVTINPCNPVLDRIGIRFLAQQEPVVASCLRAEGLLRSPRGTTLSVYRRG
ncbi:MAG: DUF7657 domain-containing protein [Acidimicrobiia bacterium]